MASTYCKRKHYLIKNSGISDIIKNDADDDADEAANFRPAKVTYDKKTPAHKHLFFFMDKHL